MKSSCGHGGRTSPEEPEEPDEPETPDQPDTPDEPTPTVPQTGGSRAALRVGALLILALGGLGIVLILLNVRINNNECCGGPRQRPLQFLKI